jgi:hypothetical protein
MKGISAMLKRLLLIVVLALVYGVRQAHAQMPTPSPTPREPVEFFHPDEWKRATAQNQKPEPTSEQSQILQKAPEPCRAVTFVEQVSPPGHMAFFLGTLRLDASKKFVEGMEKLELRKSIVLKLRGEIASSYGSSKRNASPALKILDDELKSIERETNKLRADTTEKCKSINEDLKRPDMH